MLVSSFTASPSLVERGSFTETHTLFWGVLNAPCASTSVAGTRCDTWLVLGMLGVRVQVSSPAGSL